MSYRRAKPAVVSLRFQVHGVNLWGVNKMCGVFNHCVCVINPITGREETFNLRNQCSHVIFDTMIQAKRECCSQTSAIYTWDPEHPTIHLCPAHYKSDVCTDPKHSSQMSVAANAMCDFMKATRFARESVLTLQHINKFLGVRYTSKDDLFRSKFLRQVVDANFSSALVKEIYKRSARFACHSVDSFSAVLRVADEDKSSDFEDETDEEEEDEEDEEEDKDEDEDEEHEEHEEHDEHEEEAKDDDEDEAYRDEQMQEDADEEEARKFYARKERERMDKGCDDEEQEQESDDEGELTPEDSCEEEEAQKYYTRREEQKSKAQECVREETSEDEEEYKEPEEQEKEHEEEHEVIVIEDDDEEEKEEEKEETESEDDEEMEQCDTPPIARRLRKTRDSCTYKRSRPSDGSHIARKKHH